MITLSDDNSDEDTAKREEIADDSSIATTGSLRYLSRVNVDDSHRPRGNAQSPSFTANDTFLGGRADTRRCEA